MAMKPGDIEDMIKAGIPGAKVTIRSLPRQEPRAAAPDGLRGAEGQYGWLIARSRSADLRAGLICRLRPVEALK
jgi:hypothetical protein